MSELLYSVEREVAHPISDLWTAWTDAAALEDWYHPTVLACVPGLTVSEPRVGGLWTVAVDVPMNCFVAYFYGEYLLVEPNSRIEHTLHYTQSLEEFQARDMSTPSHLVVLEFDDRGDCSWVKFSQFGELPEGQAEQAQAGMESYLDSLEGYLAR
ncbi:MAG: hypothetical protein RLZZ600_1154 [Actinomycetota bacterium]|jgi:uncharacterized protein YndB with AHSA1/START domain